MQERQPNGQFVSAPKGIQIRVLADPDLGLLRDKEIALRYNTSHTSVRKWRSAAGIQSFSDRKKEVTEKIRLNVLADPLLGFEPDHVLAHRHGISVISVCSYRNQANIKSYLDRIRDGEIDKIECRESKIVDALWEPCRELQRELKKWKRPVLQDKYYRFKPCER